MFTGSLVCLNHAMQLFGGYFCYTIVANEFSEIMKRAKIQSTHEHDILFEEWKRMFYSGASKEELMPLQTLLTNWEIELKKDE